MGDTNPHSELIRYFSNNGLCFHLNNIDPASIRDMIQQSTPLIFPEQLSSRSRRLIFDIQKENPTSIQGHSTNFQNIPANGSQPTHCHVCWWCREYVPSDMKIDGIPINIQQSDENHQSYVFDVLGKFCSERCMLSFAMYARYEKRIQTNIRWLSSIQTRSTSRLEPVPHFSFHQNWGGSMDDETFRNTTFHDKNHSIKVPSGDECRKLGGHTCCYVRYYQDIRN